MSKDAGEQTAGGMQSTMVILVVLMFAAGAGAAFTRYMAPRKEAATPAKAEAAVDRATSKSTAPSGAAIVNEYVLPLEPMMVNVGLSKRWLRMEGAVTFKSLPSKDEQALLLRQLNEDLLGFLRTTPLAQLETAVGLEFLRDDITDLVRIRSNGKARGFIFKSLLVE